MLGAEAGKQEGRNGCSESEGQSDTDDGDCEGRAAVLTCGGEIEFGTDEEEEEDDANIADHFEWMQAGGRKDEGGEGGEEVSQRERSQQETACDLTNHAGLP